MAGSGKTRLATEIALATQAIGREVALVDLTVLPIRMRSCRRSRWLLGWSPARRPAARCAELLRDALLIVDNAEHVIDAIAGAISGLLRYAPGLSVLVTSQRPLLITGEELHQVGPLAPGAAADLFCQRSGIARNADVDAICAAVDRLPLGIELAAGLTRTMTSPSWPAESPTGYDCSSAAPATTGRAIRACAPLWTGATNSSTRRPKPYSADSPSSPAAAHSRRPRR